MIVDCSKDVLGYHDDEVTLPQADRTAMRKRRDANRKRVKDGLEANEDPRPIDFKKQGSYAMKTMVQHVDNAYDIDDGVYFDKEDLKGRNGGYITALDARNMVRDAVDDGCFKTKPEVRTNCVRVYYEGGYHVDIPVYRKVVSKDWLGNETFHFELAAADWKRSDACDVTTWFHNENQSKSPDKENGRQLRRITRLIKDYAQSRPSWEGQIAGGFMITKLVTECYVANGTREDQSLYYTMRAIRDRLALSLVVAHPVTPGDTITKGNADPKARVLKEKLSDALTTLEVLFEPTCTRKEALAAWDKVFNTDYFGERLEEEAKASDAAVQNNSILSGGIISSWGSQPSISRPVQKEGGGRYA